MKTLVCLALLLCTTRAIAADAAQPGPHKVLMLPNVKLVEVDRQYTLGMIAFVPQADRPMPVIIFSHGLGGSGAGYSRLLEHWASHGYVCIAPTHADSQLLIKDGRPNVSGWAQRTHDIRLIIESLNPLQERYPELRDRIDVSRIGVGGHSFGAHTSQLIGGATVDIRGGEKGRSFADHRPSAILLLSGQGTQQQGLTKQSWQNFTKPLMVMTGSEDRGMRGQDPQWRLEPYENAPAGDKYAVFIEGANHMSFSGRLARGENQREIFDYIKAATLTFWDAYLKRDEQAKARLQAGEFAPSDQLTVEFRHK